MTMSWRELACPTGQGPLGSSPLQLCCSWTGGRGGGEGGVEGVAGERVDNNILNPEDYFGCDLPFLHF